VGGLDPIADLVATAFAALRSHYGHDVVALFLAGVFAWSGAAKLRRPQLAALAIADFGLVQRPRRLYGLALGFLEIGLACALAAEPGMPLVLGAVSLALVAFTVLVARAVWRSESFACFCFGGGDEVSSATLLRNLALLALVALLWSPTPGAAPAPSGAPALSALVAIAALATTALLGRVPRLFGWNREVREHFESRAREATT
jgi:methylamine utilization protein MauE